MPFRQGCLGWDVFILSEKEISKAIFLRQAVVFLPETEQNELKTSRNLTDFLSEYDSNLSLIGFVTFVCGFRGILWIERDFRVHDAFSLRRFFPIRIPADES